MDVFITLVENCWRCIQYVVLYILLTLAGINETTEKFVFYAHHMFTQHTQLKDAFLLPLTRMMSNWLALIPYGFIQCIGLRANWEKVLTSDAWGWPTEIFRFLSFQLNFVEQSLAWSHSEQNYFPSKRWKLLLAPQLAGGPICEGSHGISPPHVLPICIFLIACWVSFSRWVLLTTGRMFSEMKMFCGYRQLLTNVWRKILQKCKNPQDKHLCARDFWTELSGSVETWIALSYEAFCLRGKC